MSCQYIQVSLGGGDILRRLDLHEEQLHRPPAEAKLLHHDHPVVELLFRHDQTGLLPHLGDRYHLRVLAFIME
jgi:hypothetical protein